MQRSWRRAVPRGRKAAQVMPVTRASVFVSAAALCHRQSPGTAPTTVRVDAGVGRCPGAGAMQNMQEYS